MGCIGRRITDAPIYILWKPSLPRRKRYGKTISGVYKITFNGTRFYIGSSCHLVRRIGVWMHLFRNKKSRNRRITEILQIASKIDIEILEFTSCQNEALFKEIHFISLNAENANMLNRVGRKKVRFFIVDYVKEKKKVAVFNKDTLEYIKTFDSIMAAEKVFGRDTMRRFFNGQKLSAKGCVFKLVIFDSLSHCHWRGEGGIASVAFFLFNFYILN